MGGWGWVDRAFRVCTSLLSPTLDLHHTCWLGLDLDLSFLCLPLPPDPSPLGCSTDCPHITWGYTGPLANS